MVDFARCAGAFPDGDPCLKRHSCLRYLAVEGKDWITPKVIEGNCHDWRTELGQRMAEGMGK